MMKKRDLESKKNNSEIYQRDLQPDHTFKMMTVTGLSDKKESKNKQNKKITKIFFKKISNWIRKKY